MRKGYEERYLIMILSSVMNQKTTPEPMRQLDWEKMFRLADFHHVAHVVHYGILGLNEIIPQSIRRRFFEKYLEAVYRTDRLRKAEKQLRSLMEKEKINCFFVDYAENVKSYPIEEMCCQEYIEMGSDKKGTGLIANKLRIRDFVEKPLEDEGFLYYRIPGIKVFFYNYNIFLSKPMRKFYKNLLGTIPRKEGFKHVREMGPNDQYLFYMCRLTDSYAKGEISLNQMIDFWFFYKRYAEEFSWKYIYDRLKKLKIEAFAEKMEYLVLRWFGTGAGVGAEFAEVYDAMESYILSKGEEGREISSQYLPLIKTVADCYARNRRAEEFKRLLEWAFPDRGYMETIYPELEKASALLPLFWLFRLGRYGLRICYHRLWETYLLKPISNLRQRFSRLPIIKDIIVKLAASQEEDDNIETSEAEETDIRDSEQDKDDDKETAEILK
ncbi:nucleotidyltransferase family protein [Lacrimispora sp.]|uniref:nucleotidyltransferase family protein n=1 Tax=Lacrimispora sp. TaxID=2719234 RepID=UPI0028A6AA96|nr:nucleotidyltransferase family protein [Lacrimispora sp.]